jgi:His/Glu/Gln/Arg/opine family amino acid ABC transporter permease subunit
MLYVIDYLPLILKGMLLTIQLAVLSLLISVLLGMIGALAKLSQSRIAQNLATIYTTIIRGIPDLVLMTLIFFGGQILVNNIGEKLGLEYIDINPFIAGVITIGFIFGAYMAESFRGGILAVLPSFGNNWLVLTKATALVSVIGLQDMVYNASVAGGSTRKPFTFFLVAAFLYLIITGVSDFGLRWLDKRYSVGVRKA